MDSVKHYMKSLLTAVSNLEEVGIMHRDIKPSNFLYDKKTKTGLLIDFGLSELSYMTDAEKKRLFDRDPQKKEIYAKLDQLQTQL
jgi:serine/threonine protein kinase